MLAHLSQLLNFFTGLGGLVAVLVIWLVYKDRSAHVELQAREALNFQVTLLIAGAIGGLLVWLLVGFVVLAVVALAQLVFAIVAAIKASEGVVYRYPFCLRLIPAP
jgi:uncharacterized Tic20 family protein